MLRLCVSSACALALLFSAVACGEEDPMDTGMDATADSTETGETGGPAEFCDVEWATKDNPAATNLMETWGAACTTDADCVALLGAGGECFADVLGVFAMPGGYCTKRCNLPSSSVAFENDSVDCDPAGGITCVGAMGIFTACAPPCTEHSECGREAFGCTLLPVVSASSDPKVCLMNEAECCLDEAMCSTPP